MTTDRTRINANERTSRLAVAGLCALAALVASIVRLWQIRESLWLDELHTAWAISGSAADIGPRAQLGNQSPSYAILAAVSTSLLGSHEVAVRLPSLLAGLAMVVGGCAVTWRWTSSAVAAFTVGMLLAIDHHAIFYSQEARPYALVQGAALLLFFGLWRLQTSAQLRWRAAVVAAAVALFWLHYTSVLVLAAIPVWYLLQNVRSKSAYRPRQFACDAALVVLAVIPALPHLLSIADHRGDWGLFVLRRSPLAAVQWFSLDAYVLLPVALLLVAMIFSSADAKCTTSRSAFELTAVWFVVPVLLACSLTWLDVTRLFFPRYLMGTLAAPILFCGLIVARVPSRSWRLGIGFIVVGYALLSGGMVEQFRHDGRLLGDRNQDWRSAVAWLNQEYAAAAHPVLVRSGLLEADRLGAEPNQRLHDYCLLPVTGFYQLTAPPGSLIPLPTTRAPELDTSTIAQITDRAGVWVVASGGRKARARVLADVRDVLGKHGLDGRVLQHEEFGNLGISRLEALPLREVAPNNID